MKPTRRLQSSPRPGRRLALLTRLCLLPLVIAAPLTAAAAAAAPAVSKEGDGDSIIGPDYSPDPANSPKDGVPKGATQNFELKSSDSKIYPGLKGAYTRRVTVYIPKQYVAGSAAPFIVVQDGPGYVHRVTTVLDNLIYERRVPAMIAVFVDNGGGDSKGSERGLEYDTVSDKYAQFIETEVLPKVATDYKVAFTKDPEGRATMGGSSGAACAFTMAWFRPDLYHRVLSYSGTFVAQESPDNPASPHGAWEYHEHFIPMSPPKPLRIYLEVGENDNGAGRPESTYHNWPMANERMAAVLKAKGYHYRYEFAKKAGHVDGRVMDQTLPSAMEWLWRGYPIAK
jgi:enterochelin esterase family protein